MATKTMKTLLAGLLLAATVPAFAEGHALPFSYKSSTTNEASLQRGARNFMSYCSGCHSLKYLRYNRIEKDLGIPEDLLKANLMFTSDKVGDHIVSAMPGPSTDPGAPSASQTWFGRSPPDLSLSARERGPNWIFSYLMSFYLDPTRPTGVNNLVLPNAAMPHVLGDLQGYQALEKAGEGEEHGHKPPFVLVQKGALSPEEYKEFVQDTTNFLIYAAEPGRNRRMAIGGFVLAFIVVLWILSYLLKVEYWKDVH